MRTEDILDYSAERISDPVGTGPCELEDSLGWRCRKPSYYYVDRVYSVFKEHLCEEHLLHVGVQMEAGRLG